MIRELRKCLICSGEFKPRIRSAKYCSMKCCGKAHRGRNSPRWSGGKKIAYPRDESSLVDDHRFIAEKALGHPLPKGAEVHHLDGNRKNSNPSNLVICESRKYHRLLHARQRILSIGGHPDQYRICTYCKEMKSIQEFYPSKKAVLGTGYACKACAHSKFKARQARIAQSVNSLK